ncbi:MAG: type II secretory pathway component PulF [Rhodothermales bacterium]
MITNSQLSARECNRRELMSAIAFGIEEGRPTDEVLEPLTKARMSELTWLLMFMLGPVFFLLFRSYWDNEIFSFRLRRVIDGLRDGQPLAKLLRRHMKRWVPAHHCQALEDAEETGQLRETVAILAQKPPRMRITNPALLVYGLMLYAGVAFLLTIIFPKFMRIYPPALSTFDGLFFLTAMASLRFLWLPLLGIPFFLAWRHSSTRETILLRVPKIGAAWKQEGLREAANGIAVALDHGHDIGSAIALAGQTCRFRRHRRMLASSASRIAAGQAWPEALAKSGFFDSFSMWMLVCAAATERPQAGFRSVADWCGSEAKRAHRCYARFTRSVGLLCCACFTGLFTCGIFSALVSMIHWVAD